MHKLNLSQAQRSLSLGQLINLHYIQASIPWLTFVSGLLGSLHCVGMCGGLVASSCQSQKASLFYQFGRLMSYTLLGLFASSVASLLQYQTNNRWPSIIAGSFIGIMLVIWGLETWVGKRKDLPLPSFLSKFYFFLFKLLPSNDILRSVSVGALSIFLPCGLLYGVVLSTAVTLSPIQGALALCTFWLGTLPAMLVAPVFFQKIIGPLKQKSPKLLASGLIVLGIATISYRVFQFQSKIHSHSETKTEDLQCH